jgi:hypothetical protein
LPSISSSRFKSMNGLTQYPAGRCFSIHHAQSILWGLWQSVRFASPAQHRSGMRRLKDPRIGHRAA